jgi:hypothetical protein
MQHAHRCRLQIIGKPTLCSSENVQKLSEVGHGELTYQSAELTMSPCRDVCGSGGAQSNCLWSRQLPISPFGVRVQKLLRCAEQVVNSRPIKRHLHLSRLLVARQYQPIVMFAAVKASSFIPKLRMFGGAAPAFTPQSTAVAAP